MDSEICHFWFALVCNHPTMQDCFLFFLLTCLFALCASHGYFVDLHPIPTHFTCFMFVLLHVWLHVPTIIAYSHLFLTSLLSCAIATCSYHCRMLPFAFAITAYSHMLPPLPPLQVPPLVVFVLQPACLP
jgi:hypothetical protein